MKLINGVNATNADYELIKATIDDKNLFSDSRLEHKEIISYLDLNNNNFFEEDDFHLLQRKLDNIQFSSLLKILNKYGFNVSKNLALGECLINTLQELNVTLEDHDAIQSKLEALINDPQSSESTIDNAYVCMHCLASEFAISFLINKAISNQLGFLGVNALVYICTLYPDTTRKIINSLEIDNQEKIVEILNQNGIHTFTSKTKNSKKNEFAIPLVKNFLDRDITPKLIEEYDNLGPLNQFVVVFEFDERIHTLINIVNSANSKYSDDVVVRVSNVLRFFFQMDHANYVSAIDDLFLAIAKTKNKKYIPIIREFVLNTPEDSFLPSSLDCLKNIGDEQCVSFLIDSLMGNNQDFKRLSKILAYCASDKFDFNAIAEHHLIEFIMKGGEQNIELILSSMYERSYFLGKGSGAYKSSVYSSLIACWGINQNCDDYLYNIFLSSGDSYSTIESAKYLSSILVGQPDIQMELAHTNSQYVKEDLSFYDIYALNNIPTEEFINVFNQRSQYEMMISKRLQNLTHRKRVDYLDGFYSETFDDQAHQLSTIDLVTIKTILDQLQNQDVLSHIGLQLNNDLNDLKGEHGGFIRFNSSNKMILTDCSIQEGNNTTTNLDDSYIGRNYSLVAWHMHAIPNTPPIFAGPSNIYGDMEISIKDVVITSIGPNEFNIDYYTSEGVVIDMGCYTFSL